MVRLAFWKFPDRLLWVTFLSDNFHSFRSLSNQIMEQCSKINSLNAELNPISHFLAILGVHHIFHVSGLRVKYAVTYRSFFITLISELHTK